MAPNFENYSNELLYIGTLKTAKAIAANGGITIPTGQTLAVTDSAGLTANSVILPVYQTVKDSQDGIAASAWAANHTIFVNDNVSGTYKIVGASSVFGTQSTSGTLQVEVATDTIAVGSGTNQLSAGLSLNQGTNNVQNGTIIASPTTIAAGSKINLIFSGTVTGLASAAVQIVLQRLS